MSKLTVVCEDFSPWRRNTLSGFATILVVELKLRIHDIAIHQKGAARWAQLPAKPLIRDGEVVKDASGKTQYWPVLEFVSGEVRDAFSRAVINAVRERAPHAFNNDEAAA